MKKGAWTLKTHQNMEEPREEECRMEEGWRRPPKQGVELESSRTWPPCKFLAPLCGFSSRKNGCFNGGLMSPMELQKGGRWRRQVIKLWEMEVKWKGVGEGSPRPAKRGRWERLGRRLGGRWERLGLDLGPLQFNMSRMVLVDDI